MAYEIVSTSSPSNLDGKAGFGTVIKTQRLPMSIDIAVNGLNGYTHLFGAGNPQNPVCWSYLQIRADNKTYYVLSRIADSGADHTLRSNRLASHLILQAKELTGCSAGPAAIMLGGELIDSYDGVAREIPEITLKSYLAQPPRICQRWKQLTGDAGWGGVLADTVTSNKPAYVIYSPGTDILPLFAEAINLIPASFRWKVTFSTYYSSQIERYSCLWRGVVAGSPNESAIPQGDYTVIDLTKPLPLITSQITSNSNLVSLARTGSGASPVMQQTSPSSGYTPITPPASAINKPAPVNNYAMPSAEPTYADSVSAPPVTEFDQRNPVVYQKTSLLGVWFVMFIMFLLLAAAGGALYYTLDSLNNLKKDIENKQAQQTAPAPKNTQDSDETKEPSENYSDKDDFEFRIHKLETNIPPSLNDDINNLKSSFDNLNNTCFTFVKRLDDKTDFNHKKKCSFVSENNKKNNPIQWEERDDAIIAEVKIENKNIKEFKVISINIGTLTYRKQDKAFILKIDKLENLDFVDKYKFDSPENNLNFKFSNEFLDADDINKQIHKAVNNKIETIKNSNKSNKPNNPNNNNNPPSIDIESIKNQIKEELKKDNSAANDNQALKNRIADLERAISTPVIHIGREFNPKSEACAFMDTATQKPKCKIMKEKWNENVPGPGEFESAIVIDETPIGNLIYNSAQKTFTVKLHNPGYRRFLEQYPFSVASSISIYFVGPHNP